MKIQTQIAADLKAAMLKKHEGEKSILKVILGGINQKGKEVSDEDSMIVLKKTHSGLKETLKMMKPEEDRTKVLYEILVTERYLPKQLDFDQIGSLISDIIAEKGYTSIKEMGKIMGDLKKSHDGQYDGSVASAIIKKRFSN